MDERDLVWERLHRNGLLCPFDSIIDCVHNLSGVQSQFQQFAEVSIFNRCRKAPRLKDFQSLYDSHDILNLWGQRHTLHMYTPDDWWPICDIYHDKSHSKSYMEKFSEDLLEMYKVVELESRRDTYIDKARILEILDSRMGHLLTENDYLDYLLIRNCCAKGIIFGIPAKPSIRRFASHSAIRERGWKPDAANTEKSLDEMMKRYFRYYGPASLSDFCHWSGLPAGFARNTLTRVAESLSSTSLCGRQYYICGEAELSAANKLFLLGKFDPLFVSYKHKDWIVTEKQAKEIWRSAARVESVILDGAKVIGTWRHTLKGSGMTVNINPMAKISDAAKKRIKAKAEKLASFWEKKLVAVAYL